MNRPLIAIHHLTINVPAPASRLDAEVEDTLRTMFTGTPAPRARFELSADGALVTDHKTGLQWAAEESAKRLDFDAAEKHCAALRLGGFDDWRLPDLDELESIRDLTRHEPCIDTAFFKSNSGWVWSRTPCAWSSGRAWVVYFYGGAVHGYLRYDTAFVRAVRRVSPAGQ